jgi:hypothetical protein
LQKKCEYSKIKNAGELLYCKQRGVVTCCFANESCDSWPSLQNKIYTNAREYLINKTDVLNKLVKSMGYKTCHHLNSLDASQCADDCKKLENEKFAKTCKSKGGLFKCCIRRDKRSCHECRYCCTLPMCTMPPGGKEYTEFDGLEDLKLVSQKNVLKANDLFFSTEHIYKDDDYHCLKPDSHKKKEKWRKYDMDKPKVLKHWKMLKLSNMTTSCIISLIQKSSSLLLGMNGTGERIGGRPMDFITLSRFLGSMLANTMKLLLHTNV